MRAGSSPRSINSVRQEELSSSLLIIYDLPRLVEAVDASQVLQSAASTNCRTSFRIASG